MNTLLSNAKRTLALLGLLTLVLCVGTSHAQSSSPVLQGRFTLDRPVEWAGANLPAGEYTFSLQSSSLPALITVRGQHSAAMVNARATSSRKNGGESALIIVNRGGSSYVRSLYLAELGEVLEYAAPKEAPVVEVGEWVRSTPVKTNGK